MKPQLTAEKHPDVCMVEIFSHGLSYALKNAWGLAKANAVVVLFVLMSLSLIQIWQETTSPIIKTHRFTPAASFVDNNDANVENFCFFWEFEVTRKSKLASFNWRLETAKGNFFVTPWLKDSGRFIGATRPHMFEYYGSHKLNLCVSAAATSEVNEKLFARLTYETNILGFLPWTNTVILTTEFKN